MAFRTRLPGDQDFIGGSPSVVPSDFPWPREDDEVIGFLAHRPEALTRDALGTKLGGAAIDADHFQSGEHVGFLGEGEEGFNFGGQLLLLVRREGKYAVELISE